MGTRHFPNPLHDAIKPPHQLSQINSSCRIVKHSGLCLLQAPTTVHNNGQLTTTPKLLLGLLYVPKPLQGTLTGEAVPQL